MNIYNFTMQSLSGRSMKNYKIWILAFLLFQVSFANDTLFTAEQNSYLDSKKQINMCVDPSWEPFEYIKDGEHVGIIADIFKEFQKKLPIPIKLIQTDTWAESLKYVKTGKCEILAAAAKTTERTKYLKFSAPYLTFPQVIVTRIDEKFIEDFKDVLNKKIGVVKNSAVSDLLKEKYPNINLIDVKNVNDGLYKVSNGELFGFVNTSAALSYAIAKTGLTKNLKIASKVGIDYYLSTAIKNEEYQLVRIFNSLINDFDEQTLKDIKDKWLYVQMETKADYTIVYQVALLAAFIIILILYWNSKLKTEVEQRKKTQKELDKFVQVIEQTPISVMITDTKGNIEYINPFVTKKTGFSKKDLIGKSPNILKSGYQDSDFYRGLWDTISNGKTWQGEFQNKKSDGSIFWENAIIAPIYDKKGKIAYYTSIKDDITQRLKEQEELKIAKSMADEANRAKSDFLAKMSHEIRTPMNAVLGMIYLLEQTNISNLQSGYIKKAKHAAKSLLGLINDILDFSKIEAGKFNIQVSEFNFNEMITNVLSVMSVEAEEKNLELLAHYDNDIPLFIQSDALRVEQILNNLLSNAIKFTKDGEVKLNTRLVEKDDKTATIEFSVQDTGIGIHNDSIEKIFEEFSQIDDSQTRNFQGTGLGLAISKRLVNLLGGEIWCESKKGVGSTFYFTIKCNIPEQQIMVENRYEFVNEIENLKCLVVDDNLSAIEVLEKMLLSFGYTVVSTTNGKDAIRLVNESRYDIIFLDYKMDGLDGVETFKVIKDIVKANDTKTVMVTAYTKDVVGENIEKLEIDGYLSKPISPSSLYDKIIEIYYHKEKPKIDEKIKDTKNSFEGIKILLVEDNELNREFALEVLKAWNIQTDIAVDGIEALRKIKSKDFDAVLMDIQMPHMDGLEATKIIRAMDDEYFKNVPIIAVSANALVGDREKSLNVGMQEHITKPLNPNILHETLLYYLKDKISDELIEDNSDFESENLEILNANIFDISDAMSRINNNEKVYIKILKQFREKYKDFFDEFLKILASEDFELAHKKVHEIKGISANISANILFDTFKLIDTKLRNDILPDEPLIIAMKNELEKVFDNIDQLNVSEVNSVDFQRDKVIELLDEIRDNLEIDIAKVESKLETLIPYIKQNYHSFEIELSHALDNFDTSKAKDLIDNFKKEINDG